MKIPSLAKERSVSQKLFAWYQRHKRPLPWRRTRAPYRIWVSEIMLQQTQVATVIPYYKKWLRCFPNLKALAEAPLSRVLAHWAGLGYYRRARMLHRAAKTVLRDLNGKIPRQPELLMKLPGVGRYTAGAIASIAFGEKTPVLDGNVIRILTRIFGIRKSIDRPATLEVLWERARSLLLSRDPGDFNQAMMELGATVCSPVAPECPRCPVKALCTARRQNLETSYPVRSRREKYEKIRMVALVLRNGENRFWLEKRPEHGRWGGLWTFPFWENRKNMREATAGVVLAKTPMLTIQHAFTKYRVRLDVYRSKLSRGKNWTLSRKGYWKDLSELPKLAMPSPHKRIADLLLAENAS